MYHDLLHQLATTWHNLLGVPDALEDWSMLLYGHLFYRILHGCALFGIFFFGKNVKMNKITCQAVSGNLEQDFVHSMCILPYYGAHSIHFTAENVLWTKHDSFDEWAKPNDNDDDNIDKAVNKYDYYIWLYLVVFFQSFLLKFPRKWFRVQEKTMLNKLLRINKQINFDSYWLPKESEILDRQFSSNIEQSKLKSNIHLQQGNNSFPSSTSSNENDDDELPEKVVLLAENVRQLEAISKRFVHNFLLAQVFALILIALQFGLLNVFFFGHYFYFGIDTLTYLLSPQQWQQPSQSAMHKVFPMLSTCHFMNYGTSGTHQRFDTICSLNYNLVNIYLFTFVWFALVITFVLVLTCTTIKLVRLVFLYYWPFAWPRRMTAILLNHLNFTDRPFNISKRRQSGFIWTYAMLQFTNTERELLFSRLVQLTLSTQVDQTLMDVRADEIETAV